MGLPGAGTATAKAANMMSAMGLGCVKTPKLNLRTEISSQLQSIWKTKALATVVETRQ